MNECQNAAIRDLLPLQVNGQLGGPDREAVASHLEGCAPCREEADLLRTARQALHHAPVVDAARIARALPTYQPDARETNPTVVSLASRRQVAPLWRIAAAAVLVVGGGAALAVHQMTSNDPQAGVAARDAGAGGTGSVERTEDPAVIAATEGRSATPTGAPDVTPQLTFGGGLEGLSDEDLVALIAAFDDDDMIPSAEPDGVFGVPATLADEEDI